MLQAHAFEASQFKAQDLHGLSPAALAGVAAQMLEQIKSQSQRIAAQSQQIAQRDRAIKFKDAKTRRITFELARLKAWKFAARSESMNAEQRQLFEETLAADEASLQAQLEALQAQDATSATAYFSDRGRLFQAERGRRIGVALAALGKRAGTGLTVAESSTISLKRSAVGRVSGPGLNPI